MLKPCLAALIALAAVTAGSPAAAAVTCEGLPAVALDSARVTAAVTVPGPTFTAPDGVTYANIKPFCKVSVVATPTPDSLINIEAWLPAEAHWNWRLQGVGNGGYAGNLAGPAPAMVIGMRKGFAVVSTDMGTAPGANSNADVLVGHPQKWEDWGHRATHLMTVIGKQLVAAHYDRAPQYSYFNGCSTGGQQALMLAQRYPGHYDGILAGAPAHNRTHLHSSIVWNWQAMRATPASMITSEHAKLITNEVVKACSARRGGLAGDAFLTDPRSCDWDPGVLQCPAGVVGTQCLSADQVTAARKIYRGAHHPVTGARIVSASTRGAESDTQFGWYPQARSSDPPFASLFKWVFGLTWSAASYDFNAHMA
jgi:feruloyl esterase